MNKVAGLALVVAMSIQGCDCDRRISQTNYGEIGVEYVKEGVTVTSRDATFDFGAVFMGQSGTLKLKVQNVGAGSLYLESLEKVSGASVKLGATSSEALPVFTVPFEAGAVDVSSFKEFEMVFSPPQDDLQNVVDYEVKLVLKSANTREGEETAQITLKGRAISGVCEIPSVIDFGAVSRGDSSIYEQELKNPTAIAATAFAGEIYGSDALAFSYTPESPRGSINLAPKTSKITKIQFSPTEIKSYIAFVKMRASEQCPDVAVKLVGAGVDSVLTWSPSPLKFGYASLGVEVTADLTFKNAGRTPVELKSLRALAPAEFRIIPEPGVDPTQLVIPGLSEKKIRVGFKPTSNGKRTSNLRAETNLPRQNPIQPELSGFGGGPDIRVSPSPILNFGKIAYFSGATPPSFQTRKLTVLNVGTLPEANDTEGNLKLLPQSPRQYWTITPLNADSDLTEIEIASPASTGLNSYDEAVGLEAKAGKNMLDLVIKVTPKSASGPGITKSWMVTIFSNDPDQPETKITVNADAVILPPCNYSVTPIALNFGLITPPQYRDLTFKIKNEGQNAGDICLLSNLDMKAGSNAIFSLPAGPIANKELQHQEELSVTVRSWPQANVAAVTQALGQVQMFLSSPIQPEKLVSLQASVGSSCLTIAPNDLDFGTVKMGCNSATRTFTIYNTCTSSVTVSGFAMQAAAGFPANTPNFCPGASACPEFMFVSTPNAPLTVSPGGTPVTFTAKYRPIDDKPDSGAIAINANQNGQNVTYLVTLQGKGDAEGLNTDVFRQDSKPKADILLVVDDSGSMLEEQTALATNFDSFIRFANSAGVDYNIGLITTDDTVTPVLRSGPGDPDKVLKPTTPNVENQFKAKVNVGTSGSGTEMCYKPALQALTDPSLLSTNSALLRNDAALAIVCVTDELEQSPQAVSFYYNQFLNIKGVKRSTMFTVNAIAGFFITRPPNCTADADDGRYTSMVSLTNGVKENICTPDWAKALEQLGKTAFGFRTNFFLNATPDLTGGKSITVTIDGTNIPSIDGTTIWTYDPVANSVNFEPLYVPEPGQSMEISYYVSCL